MTILRPPEFTVQARLEADKLLRRQPFASKDNIPPVSAELSRRITEAYEARYLDLLEDAQ